MENISFITLAALIALRSGLAYGKSTFGLKRPFKYALVGGSFIGVIGGAVCLVFPGVGVISACGWHALREFSVCVVVPRTGFIAACLVLVCSVAGSMVGAIAPKKKLLASTIAWAKGNSLEIVIIFVALALGAAVLAYYGSGAWILAVFTSVVSLWLMTMLVIIS